MPVKLQLRRRNNGSEATIPTEEVIFPRVKSPEDVSLRQVGSSTVLVGGGKVVTLTEDVSWWSLDVDTSTDTPVDGNAAGPNAEVGVLKVDKEDLVVLKVALNKALQDNPSPERKSVIERLSRAIERLFERVK